MKVFIMTDLEGCAGVRSWHDYGDPEHRWYEYAREIATLEASAAVEGCLEAGADEVLVVDGHGPGSMNPTLLHPEAGLLFGRPLQYPFGLDDSFDATMMVGHHAKANTDGGHICHTLSFKIENHKINGVSVGEIGINMLAATYFDVPTVLVTGDVAAAQEAQSLVPNIGTAAVKEGVKRGSASGLTAKENSRYNEAAIHMHPTKARDLIRQATRRALERRNVVDKFWLKPPYERTVVIRKTDDEPQKTGIAMADDLIDLLTKSYDWQ